MNEMNFSPEVELTRPALRAFRTGNIERAISRAMRKAASTSLRDMRSETSNRVRLRKKLKVKAVNKALALRNNTIGDVEWAVDVRGDTTRLSDYRRQLKRGVKVEVNKGQRAPIQSAFIATLASGHKGVFIVGLSGYHS